MKRWLIVLMAAGLSLCLVGAALGASAPPKTLTYSFGTAEVSMLLTKPAGNIKTATGPIKYFTISGTHFTGGVSFPVTGSGYVLGTTFHFTYTGMNSLFTSPYNEFHAEGLAPLPDPTNGSVSWGYLDFSGSATSFGLTTYTLVDPTTITIPESIQDAGQLKP